MSKCQAQNASSGYFQCGKPAKFTEGVWTMKGFVTQNFCGIHAPSVKAAKRSAKDAERREAYEASCAREAAISSKSAELAAALSALLGEDGGQVSEHRASWGLTGSLVLSEKAVQKLLKLLSPSV